MQTVAEQDVAGRTDRRRAELAALLVVAIWGISFPLTKGALEELGVWPFTALRFVGMIALGWAVVLRRARAGAWPDGLRPSIWPRRRDLPLIAVTGLLGYVLYIPMNMAGLAYTTAFSTSLLLATSPLFAALLLWCLRLERLSGAQVVGLVVSFLGVFVFVSEKLAGSSLTAGLGDALCLGSAFFFAAYSVTSKSLANRYPGPESITYALTAGGVPVVLMLLPTLGDVDPGAVTLAGWAALLWSTVVPVYVAWTLWAWASVRVGVGRASTFMYLVPVFGGIGSWLLFGEGFGLLKLGGAALILAGLILARRPSTP